MLVGFFAVAGREFVEEEAGALGDVFFVARGVGAAGILESCGVLDGEAIRIQGVGGDGFFVGEPFAFVFGLLLFAIDAGKTVDGIQQGGGIGGDPALGFQSGGVGEAGAGDGGGEGLGIDHADLEFGTEEGVLTGEGLSGAAACGGGEAFQFLEVGLLGGGELGEIAFLTTLGGGFARDGGDFAREVGDELLAEADGHGLLVGGIGEGIAKEFCVADEGGEGEGEFTTCAHDYVEVRL